MLKTAGGTSGKSGESGMGSIIYHRGVKIKETKNYIGQNITKSIAEYISIIMGLVEIRKTFNIIRNKILVIHIKSSLVVKIIRNI